MRIIYIINSLKNGGPVNMLYTLVKNLNSDICDILIIALKKAPASNTRNFSDLKCNVIVLDGGSISNSIKKVQAIVNNEKPDIVHSHGGVADIVNSHLRGTHKRFTTVHCDPDEDFSMKLGKVRGWIKATAFIHTIKRINNPIACSETVSNKISKKRGLRIRYIRNGIDLENVIGANNIISRRQIGIPDDALLFVFCGYLSKRKNVEFICRAFMEVKRKDVYLLIIGDGDLFSTLKDTISDNRIKMIGRVTEPYNYLKIANVYVSASLSEGLPLAVMEGMACGLPAMLSDIDSHQELARCVPYGVQIFSLADISQLTSMIEEANVSEIEESGKNAMKVVFEYLNAKRMAKEYYEAYTKG